MVWLFCDFWGACRLSYIHSPAQLPGVVGKLKLPLHTAIIDSAAKDSKWPIVSGYTGQYLINLGINPHINRAYITTAIKRGYDRHHFCDTSIKSGYVIRYKSHGKSPNKTKICSKSMLMIILLRQNVNPNIENLFEQIIKNGQMGRP